MEFNKGQKKDCFEYCKIKKLHDNKMDLKYKKLEKSYEELKDQSGIATNYNNKFDS